MENNFRDYPLFGHKHLDIFTNTIVPQHIRMTYPNFARFIELYLEKSSREGEATEFIHNMLMYANIDETSAFFLEEFCKNYLKELPYLDQINKKTLVKWIKQWYEATGSEQSFKFLFRVLYNKDVDFYYPSVDMLRISDGKWVVETIVRIKRANRLELFDDVVGTELLGMKSGAKGLIERVVHHSVWVDHDKNQLTDNEHYDIVDVYLTDFDPNHPISGFLPEETVRFYQLTDQDVRWTETLTYIVTDIEIDRNAGNYYKIGDEITVSHGIGVGAKAVVEEISYGNFTGVEILNGGWSYTAGVATSGKVLVKRLDGSTFYADATNQNINKPTLTDDEGNVTGPNPDYLAPVYTVPDKIMLSTDTGFGAYGYVSEIGDDGKITGVQWVEPGEQYSEFPNIEIVTTNGKGAIIKPIPNNVGGITKIKIINPGYNYSPITPDMYERCFANINVKVSSLSNPTSIAAIDKIIAPSIKDIVYADLIDRPTIFPTSTTPIVGKRIEKKTTKDASGNIQTISSVISEGYSELDIMLHHTHIYDCYGDTPHENRLLYSLVDKYKPYRFPIEFDSLADPIDAKSSIVVQFYREKNNATPYLKLGETVGVMYVPVKPINKTWNKTVVDGWTNRTSQYAIGTVKRIDNENGIALIERTSRVPLRDSYTIEIDGVASVQRGILVGLESNSNYNYITSVEEANFKIKTGPAITLSGYYKNTDGFLDSKKRIQDSYYYQAFSYVLKVEDMEREDWIPYVENALHPAGLIVFGNGDYTDSFYSYGGDPINEGWRTDGGWASYIQSNV